ncbi:hypothetical protein CWC31_05110 [Pseudoalteromonas ruthenica]|nr:hypothetical protein CWC31_05110 [Pseudoalteromonas ruthenica]
MKMKENIIFRLKGGEKFVLSMMLLCSSQGVYAGVYKCVDDGGNIAYQSTPCEAAKSQEEIILRKEEIEPEIVTVEHTEETQSLEVSDNCDSKIYGNWKASWWQHGTDGKRSTTGIGDMRWKFSRDNSFEIYSDGFTNPSKLKFSCNDLKISVLNAETDEKKSVIRVHSITSGELVVNQLGRLVHWRRN